MERKLFINVHSVMKRRYYRPCMSVFKFASISPVAESPVLSIENRAQENVSADVRENVDWDIWNTENPESTEIYFP